MKNYISVNKLLKLGFSEPKRISSGVMHVDGLNGHENPESDWYNLLTSRCSVETEVIIEDGEEIRTDYWKLNRFEMIKHFSDKENETGLVFTFDMPDDYSFDEDLTVFGFTHIEMNQSDYENGYAWTIITVYNPDNMEIIKNCIRLYQSTNSTIKKL